jgi:hypothetical protein
MNMYIATALLAVQAVAGPLQADTLPRIYDSAATAELVRRVIAASGEIPAELRDYQVTVRSAIHLTMNAEEEGAGDVPLTVDEYVSTVRWERRDYLEQTVTGHRVRVLVPAAGTMGGMLENPWVIPHLYGPTIDLIPVTGGVQDARGRALHPFGPEGPANYRYASGDTVRISIRGERVTLVPVSVRPGTAATDLQLVVGSFYIDVDRAAVARARFGFLERQRGLTMQEVGTFLDMENGLWEGRFWLPFRQRREFQVTSPFLGGAIAARVVNTFGGYTLNTGWSPGPGPRRRLVRAEQPGAFAEWEPVGVEAAEYAIGDFGDLRRQVELGVRDELPPLTARMTWERFDHLFRYNRVEGAFVGLGTRIRPGNVLENPWEAYMTGGWAFAEGTPRGELRLRRFGGGPYAAMVRDNVTELSLYRRLEDTRSFLPTLDWDLFWSLPALLGGSDLRDYYDATGAALSFTRRTGPWRNGIGVRWERHTPVQTNTQTYLLGTTEEFGPVAPADSMNHLAVEVETGFRRGPGAFGIGRSTVASLQLEGGFGDLRFGRALGLLSLRNEMGLVTLATRFDAGYAAGDVPLQRFFRFGRMEGLRGYGHNEFGGTAAALGRARVLVGLPPRTTEPLWQAGLFVIPPLRPSLVTLGETGYAAVAERHRERLALVGAAPTGGMRTTLGVGFSLFDDLVTIERLFPLDADRSPRWYFGLVQWF